jgi:hypothetical protein
MKTITSAADVQAAFPSVEFDEVGVGTTKNGMYLNCQTAYAYDPPKPGDTGTYVLDGEFSARQIQALAYWATHLAEFAVPGATKQPKPELGVSVNCVLPAFALHHSFSSAHPDSNSSVNCVADVVSAFPNAQFDAEGIFQRMGAFVNCMDTYDAGAPGLVLDGSFSLKQLLALAYWSAHTQEFEKVAAN